MVRLNLRPVWVRLKCRPKESKRELRVHFGAVAAYYKKRNKTKIYMKFGMFVCYNACNCVFKCMSICLLFKLVYALDKICINRDRIKVVQLRFLDRLIILFYKVRLWFIDMGLVDVSRVTQGFNNSSWPKACLVLRGLLLLVSIPEIL